MKTLSVEDEVEHKIFGRGIVQLVVGYEGSAKYTIKFGKKFTKVIMAKYVKLVKKQPPAHNHKAPSVN